MTAGSFRFDRFVLDPGERQLRAGDAPVELNGRYLDALVLMVREQGKLVSKDRFLEEVWHGVPVTDEALTQCIRTLRRQLGDDAAQPRFIETVPKHGYRFIAPVEWIPDRAPPGAHSVSPGADALLEARGPIFIGAAGTAGGGAAGVLVGLLYGLAGASTGSGALSALLVLMCLGILCGLIAGVGVAFGIAFATRMASDRPWLWSTLGGAAGGIIVGAFGKLLGLDAFNLLFGRSPGDITGASEGALLGGAVGLGAWLATRAAAPLARQLAPAALAGAIAGALIPAFGGRTMGGSLDLLARGFPDSRLNFDRIGAMFGESTFGAISQSAAGAVEGALFATCVVGAMLLARKR